MKFNLVLFHQKYLQHGSTKKKISKVKIGMGLVDSLMGQEKMVYL